MIPIYLSAKGGKLGYTLDEFSRNFIRICESHYTDGRALAFAFIVYDFTNAEIVKVLNDAAYWKALDDISGQYLTVFSFHRQPRKVARIVKSGAKALYGVASFSAESDHQFMQKAFDYRMDSENPVVLFFQVDQGKVVEMAEVQLKSSTIEDSFNEIRALLRSVVSSLRYVDRQNDGSRQDIFNLVSGALIQFKAVRIIKKTGAVGKTVAEILSLI